MREPVTDLTRVDAGSRTENASINEPERLLAILLDSGGAQSGKAMLINRELPG